MVELIISTLISFGYQANYQDREIIVNRDVLEVIRSSSEFERLGGDRVLDQYTTEGEPVVVTDQVDPKTIK